MAPDWKFFSRYLNPSYPLSLPHPLAPLPSFTHFSMVRIPTETRIGRRMISSLVTSLLDESKLQNCKHSVNPCTKRGNSRLDFYQYSHDCKGTHFYILGSPHSLSAPLILQMCIVHKRQSHQIIPIQPSMCQPPQCVSGSFMFQ